MLGKGIGERNLFVDTMLCLKSKIYTFRMPLLIIKENDLNVLFTKKKMINVLEKNLP
jgi:hypothetical protein